ncbi:hypothetical protein RSAG8_11145, partial [Rhizoctonia solani AG-8 WAC10335]
MSRDPDTYKIFLSPGLASGCITLMATVEEGGKASPFSYEYGYLCFRLLLFSLGASLLSRSGDRKLEEVVRMMEDPRYAICFIADIFSARIAESLRNLVPLASQQADCDWILGWGAPGPHPRYDQIISREQTKILFNMLWEDRVNFLRAMFLTFTPGLSVLSFLNWRHTCLEKKSAEANHDLLKRTSEIQWRCLLVTTTNQDGLMIGITDHFCAMTKFVPAKGKSMFQKSEDPRGILEAYISRLAPTNLAMYDSLSMAMLPALLELVVPNLGTDVEDLLPTLFEVTLSRLWEALREEECTYDSVIVCIALTLEQFRTMFKTLRAINITRPTIARILEELVQGSLLDFIASLFLLLNPDAEENTREDNTNFNLIQTTKAMIDELGMSSPLDLLKFHFRDYAMSWPRIYDQFDQLRFCTNDPRDLTERHRLRDKHYRACMAMWTDLMEILGQEDNIQQSRELSGACVYDQCQDPGGQGGLGAFYACPRCLASSYCSTRCQIGDWNRGLHKKNCSQLAKLYEPANFKLLAEFAAHLAYPKL